MNDDEPAEPPPPRRKNTVICNRGPQFFTCLANGGACGVPTDRPVHRMAETSRLDLLAHVQLHFINGHVDLKL